MEERLRVEAKTKLVKCVYVQPQGKKGVLPARLRGRSSRAITWHFCLCLSEPPLVLLSCLTYMLEKLTTTHTCTHNSHEHNESRNYRLSLVHIPFCKTEWTSRFPKQDYLLCTRTMQRFVEVTCTIMHCSIFNELYSQGRQENGVSCKASHPHRPGREQPLQHLLHGFPAATTHLTLGLP